MRPLPSRLHQDERGSVTLLTAVAAAALLGATALAVDIGRITLGDREAQSTADLAALDAVRAVGDRRDPAQDTATHASTLAAHALARNDGFLDLAGAAPGVTATVGRWDATARAFTPTTVDPNAVSVSATADLPHAVLAGRTAVARGAIAMVEEVGGLSIGSVLASASIDEPQAQVLDGVLTGLLATSVDLDVVGYRGLADADVHLGELLAQLGVGTAEEAATATVTVAQLADATAVVLSRSTETSDAAAITPLGVLATSAGTASFQLLELLTVGPDDGALEVEVGVLDLVLGAAAVANGTSAVTAALPLTIPGVASATATVAAVETPRIATGAPLQLADGSWATTARTAQGRALIELVLPDAVTIVTLVGDVTADLTVATYVELGRGSAELHAVTCPDPTGTGSLTAYARTSGAAGWLGRIDPTSIASGTPVVAPVTLVDVAGLVRVTGTAATVLPGAEGPLTFTTPTDVPQRISGGSPDVGGALAGATSVTVEALTTGLDTGAIAADVLAETQRVLRELDAGVLDDLAAALGVSVADADVRALGVDCSGRRLVR